MAISGELRGLRWSVPKAGYIWMMAYRAPSTKRSGRSGEPPRRYLVEEPSLYPLHYEPAEDEPSLFRKFAAVDPTEGGILDFANRYGWLGIEVRLGGKDATTSLVNRGGS